mmetsp:Transcript_35536/g.102119  ORF Transcript_35536/g.102119 Transcript_35536/m.102119 type:complete len:234 (+) Transcript_35536:1887-2588(+)
MTKIVDARTGKQTIYEDEPYGLAEVTEQAITGLAEYEAEPQCIDDQSADQTQDRAGGAQAGNSGPCPTSHPRRDERPTTGAAWAQVRQPLDADTPGEAEQIARHTRDEVDEEEAAPAVDRLYERPHIAEGRVVHHQVEQVGVEEYGREEPVPLAHQQLGVQLGPRLVEGVAPHGVDDKHHHVEPIQQHTGRQLGRRHPHKASGGRRPRLQTRAHGAGSQQGIHCTHQRSQPVA